MRREPCEKKTQERPKERALTFVTCPPLPIFLFFPFFQSFFHSYLNALKVVVGGNNNSHHCHNFSQWAINFKLQQKRGSPSPLHVFLVVTQKEREAFHLPFVVIIIIGVHQQPIVMVVVIAKGGGHNDGKHNHCHLLWNSPSFLPKPTKFSMRGNLQGL